MELLDVLRTTAAIRDFTDEAVPDEVVARILDTARFAPSGGNAQSWHVVVVRDPERRRALRDLYLDGWYDYLAMGQAGLRAWAPTNDPQVEAEAVTAGAADLRRQAAESGGGFAEHLDEVPVLLAVFADLSLIAAVDRDLDRTGIAGGASVYPFTWNLLLAARAEGLGGVITTMLLRHEDEVRALLGAGAHQALAAVVALGHPVRQPSRLTRGPVSGFATIDTVDGDTLPDP